MKKKDPIDRLFEDKFREHEAPVSDAEMEQAWSSVATEISSSWWRSESFWGYTMLSATALLIGFSLWWFVQEESQQEVAELAEATESISPKVEKVLPKVEEMPQMPEIDHEETEMEMKESSRPIAKQSDLRMSQIYAESKGKADKAKSSEKAEAIESREAEQRTFVAHHGFYRYFEDLEVKLDGGLWLKDSVYCQADEIEVFNAYNPGVLVEATVGEKQYLLESGKHYRFQASELAGAPSIYFDLQYRKDAHQIKVPIAVKGGAEINWEIDRTEMPKISIKANADKSIKVKAWQWESGKEWKEDGITSSHHYKDTGIVEVRMLWEGTSGCVDTFSQKMEVSSMVVLDVPSSFDLNQRKTAKMPLNIAGVAAFELVILDKNGKIVAKITDENESWDGKDLNGKVCPSGRYYYVLNHSFWNDDRTYKKTGLINLTE